MTKKDLVLEQLGVGARPRSIRKRPRRLRRTEPLRAMIRETSLQVRHLIQPLFVTHGTRTKRPIASMPSVFQMSVDELVEEAQRVHALGVPAVLLFGISATKDALGLRQFRP